MATLVCNRPPMRVSYVVGDSVVVFIFDDATPQTVPDDVVFLVDEDDFTIIHEE